MKLKKILLFVLIFSLLTLTGCWDYKDFDNLALISAMGFDLDEATNEITVTAQYYIPGSTGATPEKKTGGKDLPNSGVVVAKGFTISEALMKIQQARRKQLFYGYMDVQVLGETFAKNMLKQFLQFTDRTPNVRSTVYLAFTQGTALDVLSTLDPNVSVSTGRSIHGLIDQSKNTGCSFPVTLHDFIQELATTGMNPVAPRVSVKRTEISESGSGSAGSGSDSSKAGQSQDPYKISVLQKGYHYVDSTAAFQGETLIGWLNTKESTGLEYILNKGAARFENVKLSPSSDMKNTLFFLMQKVNSKIKPEIINGKPVFTIETSVEADLRKYAQDLKETDFTPEVISGLEKRLSENVKSEISAAVEKGQKQLKSDIFGFGFSLYRKNPGLWHSKFEKDWQKLFPDVQINISVKAKLVGTGANIKKFIIK